MNAKKLLLTLATAVTMFAASAASAGWYGHETNGTRALFYLGQSNHYAHLASRYFVSFNKVQYSLLYRAYRHAYNARVNAYRSYLNAPVGSNSEYYALQAYRNLRQVEARLWAIYRNGGASYNYSQGTLNYATNANTQIANSLKAGYWRR